MSTITQRKSNPRFITSLLSNVELIAALFSGLLILIAWLLGNAQQETASIIFYILAFVIGGYANA